MLTVVKGDALLAFTHILMILMCEHAFKYLV